MFVTRVSTFLEQNEYKLSYEGSADIEVIHQIVASHTFTVSPGVNKNHADISISYSNKITLNFSIRDLHQEKSPMIQSMKASVVEDTSSDEYDYWDSIPPYGVVEVYEVELIDRAGSEESEIEALFRLVNSYLMNTFLMFTYRSSEITKIEKYIQEDIQFARMYTHEGESCYRLKMLGW